MNLYCCPVRKLMLLDFTLHGMVQNSSKRPCLKFLTCVISYLHGDDFTLHGMVQNSSKRPCLKFLTCVISYLHGDIRLAYIMF